MSEGIYNLLDEPWILATDLDNHMVSCSLTEVFEKAHQLKSLAGELPTQDVAVLRLLLAVLHTVFYRFQPDGTPEELDEQEQAIARWKELWQAGRFPADLIRNYLEQYRERFFLFHEEYPFLQVKDGQYRAKSGQLIAPSDKELMYFVGEIAQSANKDNLFLSRRLGHVLECAEAARWLIHMNSFDLSPSGAPPKNETKIKGYQSAWLANLGIVYLQGENLFQTLMLNLYLGPQDEDAYENPVPLWEDSQKINGSVLENISAPAPVTLAELYSRRFRYLELKPNEGKTGVVGVSILSGCKFDDDNQAKEPMTVWKIVDNSRKPKMHTIDKRIWQDFSALMIPNTKKTERPGILNWVSQLQHAGKLNIGKLRIQTVGQDTKNNSALKDVFSDGLSIHSILIEKIEEGGWLLRVNNEIAAMEEMANVVGELAKNIERAKGEREGKGPRQKAKEQAYSRLDVPFRQWLEQINPEADEPDEQCGAWRNQAHRIVRQLGEELVAQAGPKALVGHKWDKQWYTVSDAQLQFLSALKKITQGR